MKHRLEAPKGKGKSKGKKGGGRGGGSPSERKYTQAERSANGPCFQFKTNGQCKYGDGCKYSHLPSDTGRTAAGELTKTRKREEAAAAAAAASAKPKAKAKAKAETKADPTGAQGRGKKKGSGRGRGNEFTKAGVPKKQILCKFIRDGKPCPLGGDKCPFGHKRKNFDSGGQYIARGAGVERSTAQGSDEQWDPPPLASETEP